VHRASTLGTVSLHRPSDQGPPGESVGRLSGTEEIRRIGREAPVATGTLACPSCDAPVGLAERPLTPREALTCGFCAHAGPVRDFLSLGEPTRATHVVVRISAGSRVAIAPRASRPARRQRR
jgi:hypothetical protein